MFFPIVIHRCESWTMNKAEHWRIVAFKLWCWKKLLRVSWTVGRPNHSILKEIHPEYSLEELTLELKLQNFGPLMQRVDSLEQILMLGKIEGRKRRGQQRMRWLDGNIDSMNMSLSKLWKIVKDREAWRVAVYGVTKSWTWLSDWTQQQRDVRECSNFILLHEAVQISQHHLLKKLFSLHCVFLPYLS